MKSEDFFISIWEAAKEKIEVAKEILEENEFPGDLPEDAFVFFHLSHAFEFFRLSEGEDPPVYTYVEGHESFRVSHQHFSDWLLHEIEIHKKVLKRM